MLCRHELLVSLLFRPSYPEVKGLFHPVKFFLLHIPTPQQPLECWASRFLAWRLSLSVSCEGCQACSAPSGPLSPPGSSWRGWCRRRRSGPWPCAPVAHGQNSGGRYPIWFNSMFEFCQKMIHSIFDSILLYPRFNSKYYSIQKKSADSIQKIIQFNSQRIIDTSRIGKVPKNCPKSVQNRQKRGLFIKNGKYRFKIWFIHSFHDKIQFKGLFNIIFSGIFNSKNYSIIFFPGKFNSKIDSKI